MLVTDDRSIIVTADVGNATLLVLWNSKNGTPIQSISQPHKYGTVAMDISLDDEWLATLGAVDPESGEQEVRFCAALTHLAEVLWILRVSFSLK
jgi:hypothetical protein